MFWHAHCVSPDMRGSTRSPEQDRYCAERKMPDMGANNDHVANTGREPVVALTGITKRFGAFTANDGVDLSVQPGEVHALLGENGAGKSTLVKILYGLLQPDAGQIRRHGKLMRFQSPAEARASGVGMVFQHFSLFDTMSVLENIALGCDGEQANRSLRERVVKIAAEYGLGIDCNRMVWSLSAGERQRIEILRCLLQEPDLIILDEPTSVLTPAESEALFLTLQKLKGRGTSVLFISHKLDEIRQHCSKATILRQGKVVAICDPRLETAKSLAGLMVGETLREIVPKPHRSGEAVLELEGVSTRAEDEHAVQLQDLTLSVHAGEIVAIAGIAGNGQSELFACISGESGAPHAGSVSIGGHDVLLSTINERRRLGAVFVPEERLGHAAVPAGRLSANLVLTWHAVGGIVRANMIDWRKVERKTAGIVAEFDVRSSAPNPESRRLSGGNLQKFVVGRDLTLKPKLIVVNQPSWGIDAAAATAIRQALLDCATAGAAVLVISQDLDEILDLADRIAVITAGHLSMAVKKSETDRERIGLLMTGSPDLSHATGQGSVDAA
jgi:ABC-type uncharacterized transport system ATPase subunit